MPDLPELDEILEKLVEDTLGIKYWDAAEGILHPAFAEAEAKLNKLLIEARKEYQREQLEFMSVLLREHGGRIEISRKSFMQASPKDEVVVWEDKFTGKMIYELKASLREG